jgi:hypothetical protein
MAGWGGESRAEGVELMVQMLAGNYASRDQPAAVAHRVQQRLEGSALDRAAAALTGQGDERGAVAVVVLEAARAQLGARRLGL